MVGEMWRESALISSPWSLSSSSLFTQVYLLVMCVVTTTAHPMRFALDTDGVPIAVEDNFLLLNTDDGTYTFAYDTGGGDQQSFRMEVRDASGQVSGRFGYIDPEGALRITNYVADASGYRSTMTVFHRANKKPVVPSLVVGHVPNELPSLDSIDLPTEFTSRHRGEPENIIPPEGTPLLIIGPLPRELQPEEIIENETPEAFPIREVEPIEIVREEFEVHDSINNELQATISDNLQLINLNRSSDFNVSLSLDEITNDSFLKRAFEIQEMQSNELSVSDIRNNEDLIFNTPLQNPLSSSVQLNSETDLNSLSSTNVDNRLFVERASLSDVLFSKVQSDNLTEIDTSELNEEFQFQKFSDEISEDTLSIEKLKLESSTVLEPTKTVTLQDTDTNSNIFEKSTWQSGSTRLRQIVPDYTVPQSKSNQGYRLNNSELPPDLGIRKETVPQQCCDNFDTEKASSLQISKNLPYPSSLFFENDYSLIKQIQDRSNRDGTTFFGTSNQESDFKISKQTSQNIFPSFNESDDMPSIFLPKLLYPKRNNSNILSYQGRKSSRPYLRSVKFPFYNWKFPKSNIFRKLFLFF